MTAGSLLSDNLKSNLKGQHQSSSAAQQWVRWFWKKRFLGTAIRRETWRPLIASASWPLWLAGIINMIKYMSSDCLARGEKMEDWQLPSTANRLCLFSSSFQNNAAPCYRVCCSSSYQQLTTTHWELERLVPPHSHKEGLRDYSMQQSEKKKTQTKKANTPPPTPLKSSTNYKIIVQKKCPPRLQLMLREKPREQQWTLDCIE